MYEVRYIPTNEMERNVGTRIMEQNREKLNIDGKIFSHTFATKENGFICRHGSVSCYVPKKTDAHYLAFEIETKIPCTVEVE